MDAFFASVEQLDCKSLRGKPLIVGGNPNSRGVVAACSYEARKYGIHSAMPCSKANKLCSDAIFVRPRMDRYREISNQIMVIFKIYTHLVEPLSLDEAFLDVTTNTINNPSATLLANSIRNHIYKETGLTASAGVSYNKFLAKIASNLNKPNGTSVITPEQAYDFLSQLPIGNFFGVGKVTEKKMLSLGVNNGKTLRQLSKSDLIFHFGKAGAFFYNIVRGHDTRKVVPSRKRKSIGTETTLQHDTSDLIIINEILITLSDKIAKNLIEKQCGALTLTLKIRYHNFTTVTRSITIREPILGQLDISQHLPNLLSKTDAGKTSVRLIGLTVSNLTNSRFTLPKQMQLPFMSFD